MNFFQHFGLTNSADVATGMLMLVMICYAIGEHSVLQDEGRLLNDLCYRFRFPFRILGPDFPRTSSRQQELWRSPQ